MLQWIQSPWAPHCQLRCDLILWFLLQCFLCHISTFANLLWCLKIFINSQHIPTVRSSVISFYLGVETTLLLYRIASQVAVTTRNAAEAILEQLRNTRTKAFLIREFPSPPPHSLSWFPHFTSFSLLCTVLLHFISNFHLLVALVIYDSLVLFPDQKRLVTIYFFSAPQTAVLLV